MELLLDSETYSRVFILFSNTAATAPVFSEWTLTTEGGRMDVVARSALYALWDTKNAPRRNTLFIAVLNGPPNPPVSIYIPPFPVELSETAIGLEILKTMKGLPAKILLERAGLTDLIEKLQGRYRLTLLIENGVDIKNTDITPREKHAFIIGDHIGFPPDILKELRRTVDLQVSIGPLSYLASHCIAFINEWLDAQ
ncbi:MAG: hypothetical protein ABWK01_00635 [Infirmifilum sp.]